MEAETKAEDAKLFQSETFDPDADCDALRKDLSKTFGADEDGVIEVLSMRSQQQREQITVPLAVMKKS